MGVNIYLRVMKYEKQTETNKKTSYKFGTKKGNRKTNSLQKEVYSQKQFSLSFYDNETIHGAKKIMYDLFPVNNINT